MSENEMVDVVACGYEWICPICDTYHRIISFPKNPVVVCDACETTVKLNSPKHAYD